MPTAAPVLRETLHELNVVPVANVIVQPVAVVPSVTCPEKSVPVAVPGEVPQDDILGAPGLVI
jgi:hypothetical protein